MEDNKRNEPEKFIPDRSDVVDAIIHSIASGVDEQEFCDFLQAINPSSVEIYNAIRNVDEGIISISGERADVFMLALKNFAKGHGEVFHIKKTLDLPSSKCALCTKEKAWNELRPTKFITANNDDTFNDIMQRDDSDRTEILRICSSCYNLVDKKSYYCDCHQAYVKDYWNVVCTLHPNKCKKISSCNNPVCLEKHFASIHNRYSERRWRFTKKFVGGRGGDIITSDLLTGVEIEVVAKDPTVSRTNIYKLDNCVGITSDESMQHYFNPTEIITPKANLRNLETLVKDVCNKVRIDGFIPNGRCSVHLHIDLEKKFGGLSVNPLYYKSLLLAYAVFEHVFMSLVPKIRANNRYAQSIRGMVLGNYLGTEPEKIKLKKLSYLWYGIEQTSQQIAKRMNTYRDTTKYTAFNFHSLLRGQGLEIRTLEGTIKPETILMWANLHHKFAEAISQLPYPMWNHPAFNEFTGNISHDREKQRLKDIEKEFYRILETSFSSKEEFSKTIAWIEKRKEMALNSSPLNCDNYLLPQRNIRYIPVVDGEQKKDKNNERTVGAPTRDEFRTIRRELPQIQTRAGIFTDIQDWTIRTNNE